MNKLIKIIISLVLILIFVLTCFFAFVLFSFASWLHTYKAFTQKNLVAEITVSPVKKDEEGFPYAVVKYKEVKDESALMKILTSKDEEEVLGEEKEFKIYGDSFEIGGQVVKFNDFWYLFNLHSIYKVTRIDGRFMDTEVERNLPKEKRSIYDINGGTDDIWKKLQRNESKYDFLVDTVMGSFSSKFFEENEVRYNLYISEDGFILDRIDD